MSGFDEIMARASRALVEMDYLACEADCLEGLALARSESDFTAYRRALRPLQEARRARRMLAADDAVWIGPPPPVEAQAGDGRPARVIATGGGCCCVQGSPAAAAARLARARAHGLHAEVLVGEPAAEDPARWTVGAPPAAEDPNRPGLFFARVRAPATAALGVALHPDEPIAGLSPRHWFVEASEAVGDAALAWAEKAAPAAGTLERLAALETAVAAVGDHELLHQALADAAAALELVGGGAA